MSINTLAKAISGVPVTSHPMPMPLAHLTSVRWLTAILQRKAIVPTYCTVFARNILYLFYGGVLYRPGNAPTRSDFELPVGFLFHPAVLNDVNRYFPFDTGAVAHGRFGNWSNILTPFKRRFAVPGGGKPSTASHLVACLFDDNRSYLKGTPATSLCAGPDPFPLLHSFYSADITGAGTDHRQHAIECHFYQALALDRNLLWVSFPEELTPHFADIYELTKPHVPEFSPYRYHMNFVPAQVAAQLETEAQAIVERYVTLP